MHKVLIVNGSINSEPGNTQKILDLVKSKLKGLDCEIKFLQLVQIQDNNKENYDQEIKNSLDWSDAVLFATGTYWDSWGSPMQKFLERACVLEATESVLFKPCAVIVSMHFVGGKEVLSRLQGVLNTMGFLIPPMTGFVYSLASHTALKIESSFDQDFWSLEDLDIVLHNLLVSTKNKNSQNFLAWPVDRKDPKRIWLHL